MNRRAVVALAGGVGAARFLDGLTRVMEPERVFIIGNTADDVSNTKRATGDAGATGSRVDAVSESLGLIGRVQNGRCRRRHHQSRAYRAQRH